MMSTQETMERKSRLPVREQISRPIVHRVRGEQVVHAWSLSGGHLPRVHVEAHDAQKTECPPEVYIG